ncbi:MAG: hypothetical protein ACK55Z_05900, partial [bacterium]
CMRQQIYVFLACHVLIDSLCPGCSVIVSLCRVEFMNEKVMETLQRTLDMMVAQIVTAKRMYRKMKQQMDEDDIAEDESDDDVKGKR